MPGRSTLAFIALTLAACSGPQSGRPGASGGDEHPLVGAQAPSFDLPARVGGSKASLADAAGKVVVVDFWATWCEPCKESFPFYQRLSDKHGADVVVIGISVDEEPDGIEAFARQTGAKFTLAWDESQSLSGQYNPPTMPTSYIIDRNGIVRFVHAGFRSGDEQDIESKVESLLH